MGAIISQPRLAAMPIITTFLPRGYFSLSFDFRMSHLMQCPKVVHASDAAPSFQASCRNVDRLLGELPDRDERAQNQAWIHYELERIATLFFGANQKGVSGLLLVLRLIYCVRLFIHDTNFTRQVLAAMTMIIKFLPRHIAAVIASRSRARVRG